MFPPENNSIEVLAPRFEYELVDKDQIRIGNIQINTNQIQFKIKTLDSINKIFKINFQWPVGLLSHGEIAIKDNSGKSLWIKKFTPNEVLSSTKTTLAYFETTLESDELLNSLEEFPFFSFCIHNELVQTKIYLCSKEFFLTKNQSQYIIQERAQTRSNSFVEINGQTVGPKGFVFLNSPSESVSMRTLLLSGATLDIETRMKKIDFKDLSISKDKKELILVGQGTEPVKALAPINEDKVDLWSARMNAEEPFIYLYGEGRFPLRYEFLTKQEPHDESLQVKILSPLESTTIRSTHLLKLKPPTGYILQSADQKSKISVLNDGTYDWTLQDLKKNRKQRKYLLVKSKNINDKKKYVAAYDIERKSFLQTDFRLFLPFAVQGQMILNHVFEWPIEFNLFYKNNTEYDNKKDVNLAIFSLASQWLLFKDSENQTILVDGALNLVQLDTQSSNIFSVGVTHRLKNKYLWTDYITEFHTRAKVFALPLGSESVIKNGSFDIEVSAQKVIPEDLSLSAGLKFQSLNFEKSNLQHLYSFFGVGWNF